MALSTRYTPAGGRHAPPSLRALLRRLAHIYPACLNWWEALPESGPLAPTDTARWATLPAAERTRWLLGQLWDCTDHLPDRCCDFLTLPRGSTYARAARYLLVALAVEYDLGPDATQLDAEVAAALRAPAPLRIVGQRARPPAAGA